MQVKQNSKQIRIYKVNFIKIEIPIRIKTKVWTYILIIQKYNSMKNFVKYFQVKVLRGKSKSEKKVRKVKQMQDYCHKRDCRLKIERVNRTPNRDHVTGDEIKTIFSLKEVIKPLHIIYLATLIQDNVKVAKVKVN